jgi:hypothetical protein
MYASYKKVTLFPLGAANTVDESKIAAARVTNKTQSRLFIVNPPIKLS